MSSIYMYHAVGNETQISGADPFYAVTESNFREQVRLIGDSLPIATQIADKGYISQHCITFDDGHLSNYSVAFPILKEQGLKAEFYVNSAFIGQPDYMTWQQLREMLEAGMTIQSHGHTHPYFSDLSSELIESELDSSKKMIEDKLGEAVVVFAPPGGRYDKRVVSIAEQLGYRCIADSSPGICQANHGFTVPRFPILANTSNSLVNDYKNKYSIPVLKQTAKYYSFAVAKKVLGNKIYDNIRSKLLGETNTSV
ncbi:polysaccharide deacetylase family protein [Aliikangiella coralliicola]|uniref:Polysaccharide deacetylase family protein n=1 Tax=Aliikangiella coralliicola TaxID=2592383 RepID=A0A545UHC9_9GAMM|nr:polysaccharide deacetylase family protein [Aliikangiella coralliicola]TQV88881.1 polysaccharide deacetylase family protein [Aliikangiella coralliicola]